MDLFALFVIFIIGVSIGSFINATSYRRVKKISINGRSFCPHCKKNIAWFDLIPILSYVILDGKCRNCREKISIRYPIIELVTGLLFVQLYLFFNPILFVDYFLLIFYFILGSLLIYMSDYDIRTKEIPNSLSFLIFIISISITLTGFLSGSLTTEKLIINFISAIALFLFFFSIVYFSKETWMGGGDAKLVISLGLILGPINSFLLIFIASLLGSIYGLGDIYLNKAFNKKETHHHQIPFGPFLAAGFFISFFWGERIFDFYVKIISWGGI